MNKYLQSINEEVRDFFEVLSPEFPEWMLDYIYTPEMQRIDKIGVSCGTQYNRIYNVKLDYTNLMHSVGVALILWNFTKDKKQTLAGLFHDIATPVFKHTIDFMNGDYEKQESTEDRTEQIIRNSKEIMKLLERDNIKVEEVCNVHIYSLADNSSPRLCADRLEYNLADGLFQKVVFNGVKEVERYYNNFYMIQKNANTCEASDLDCTTTQSYSSNISQVSVYDRTISGLVFEDENYNGFNDNEANVKDVAIDLYKLSATTFDSKNPAASISSADQNVSSATSDANGEYKFEGLAKGNYYVKYTFNCNKYTVTEKNKVDPTFEGDTSTKDSDAQMVSSSDSKSCYAVSNIITLDNQNVEVKNIDLGLRVRQEFDIEIKKYITNVKVISNGNIVQDNNYDKKDKVSVSVKNLKNTSFKVTYGIEIQNTKYFPGTIGSIIETIPQGMTFDPNLKENDGWVESDGNLYYTYLNKTLIMPGEKYYLTIVLDLTTNQGGNYVNIVAADSLQIKQMVNNFLEVPEEIEIVEEEE